MTESVEASGSTVEEAIDRALDMLGATDDEVEVEILSEPSGIVRRENEARVRVRFRDERTQEDLAFEEDDELLEPEDVPALAEQAEVATEFLRGLVGTIGLEATIDATLGRESALVELHGPELALLIGRHGATLDALQEVTRAAVQRRVGDRAFVNLDVEGYRARRREILERRARSIAAKVRRSGKAQELEPMTAFERKMIHDALTDFRGVQTSSDGEEPNRYVVISPS
jgi:spoIIIJ-associated protein